MSIRVEGNYESAPGVYTNEAHLEFYEGGVTTGLYRPISAQYIHGSGTTSTTLGYADGTTPGFIGIVEQSTGAQQVKWQDNQMFLGNTATYLVQFANGGTIVNDSNVTLFVIQGNAAATMKMVFDPVNTQLYWQIPGVGTALLLNASEIQFSLPLGGGGASPCQWAGQKSPNTVACGVGVLCVRA